MQFYIPLWAIPVIGTVIIVGIISIWKVLRKPLG